jgi:hypothetical protein
VYIAVDLSVVPPRAVLHEPEDLTSFKVVAAVPDHAYAPIDEIRRLAGPLADNPEWQQGFESMLEFAAGRGWIGPDGGVRAHLVIER